MKTFVFALMLLVSAHATAAELKDRLGVFAGWSHLVTGGEDNTYNVKPNGVGGGLLIPVHLSRIPLYVEIKVLYHAADYESRYSGTYDKYIQASNSFLAAVKSWWGREYSAQILLGPGIHNESVYSKWGVGVAAAEVYGEVSTIVAKRVGDERIGLLASFERGFTNEDVNLVTDQRLRLAVVGMF